MPTSQLDALIARARHSERARDLLADVNHLVKIVRDANVRDGQAEPLRVPVYYADRSGSKRPRPPGQ